MSLAATGGGLGGVGAGGAGGLVMAHQGNNAMAMPAAPVPPPGADIPGGGSAAPSSSISATAALGADLVDKQQRLSLQQVKDLSKFPLVALDLFGSQPIVASFPPKSSDPSQSAGLMVPSVIGKMKDTVILKATESSHKTFRKWLSQTKGFEDLQEDVLWTQKPPSGDDASLAVVLNSPQQWLGLRRLSDAPDHLKRQVSQDDSTSPAIAEEASQDIGITMANGSLDGTVPQGDDFDRVVCKIRLFASKKALTVLPEEMTGLILSQAQQHVARTKSNDDDTNYTNYPICLAVPAIYCNDNVMEALSDATSGTGVFFQRSICALAGSLHFPDKEQPPSALVAHLNNILQSRHKEFQRKQMKNPGAQFEEEMLLLLTGMTNDCVECTAVQISSVQPENGNCPWGNFNVLSNVSYQHEKPQSMVDKCISELFDTLDAVAPDAAGPVAMVSYGTLEEQKVIQTKWDKLKKTLEDWEEVSHFSTKPDAVALGAAVLGAVSHGRLSVVVQVPGKKPKPGMAIQVQNVAPVAVGIMTNYHGGAKNKWTPVKTIFDFDRRVPAGPYPVDYVAAECAVYRNRPSDQEPLSEEQLLKAIKKNEGAKCIPIREEAALDLRVQVVQKWTRNGEWKKVGDVMSPLVTLDKEEKKIACEQVALELSLGATGLISTALVGERASVVQANTSARNSTIRWYVGVFLAVAFFGGFLVKSWWEERVFERDTRRLLAYYKHVLPGSMSDGDVRNARYVVWKYRNKKDKLWKSLEKKYGHPALHEYEWAEQAGGDNSDEEDVESLDDEQEDAPEQEENSEQDL